MNTKRISVALKLCALVALLMMTLVWSRPAQAASQDGIGDPGFESGALNIDTECAYLQPAGKWMERCRVSTGQAGLVPAPVHSGEWAIQIDTLTSASQHFIWQGLMKSSTCYTWEFYVLPEEGTNVAALVTAWPPSSAPSATVFRFSDSGVEFQPWREGGQAELEMIDVPLPVGQYTEIRVVAEGEKSRQRVWIGGDYIGAFTGDAPFAPETIILGDTPAGAYQADYYYDDVSLRVEECAAVGGIAEPLGVDSAASQTNGSSGPRTGVIAGIAAAAGVLAFGGAGWYVRRRRARETRWPQ